MIFIEISSFLKINQHKTEGGGGSSNRKETANELPIDNHRMSCQTKTHRLLNKTTVDRFKALFIPKKFCKFFQIFRHIESLDVCMKY